eukprot:2376058-Rhodomonas_salina.1
MSIEHTPHIGCPPSCESGKTSTAVSTAAHQRYAPTLLFASQPAGGWPSVWPSVSVSAVSVFALRWAHEHRRGIPLQQSGVSPQSRAAAR